MSTIVWLLGIGLLANLLLFVWLILVYVYQERRRQRIDRRVERMLEEELGQTFAEAEAYFTVLDDLEQVEKDAPAHQDEALS